MSSFFGRFKGTSGSSNANGASLVPKKEPNAAPQSPLETLLANSGPVRNDGSDKLFGMQNPSNTCYCNSVVQCLYYSEPFREMVINFPCRSESLPSSDGVKSPTVQPLQPQAPVSSKTLVLPVQSPKDTPKTPQRFTASPSVNSVSPLKADDTNKDSFDYQKKMAVQTGPLFDISHDNSSAYGMQTSLFTGLKDIFEAIVSQQAKFGVITLNRFLQTLREGFETFRTPLHQDAHEFLNLLLNDVVMKVEEYSKAHPDSDEISGDAPHSIQDTSHSLKRSSSGVDPTRTSWVHELFEGTLTSETRCLTCETISRRDEVFLDLSVDLDEHSSVTSCLRRFSEEEMLRERNKFHCDHCSGLQEAEKRMKIKRLPRILALHLKRFKYTEELGRLQKLFHRVVFPFHLRLFNTTDDTEDPDRLYELYAIIVHLGSTPFHGHYVSIIKTKDHGWLLFDDELVLPVNKNYVRKFFGGDPRNPACAYVLFYQQTTAEAILRDQEMDILNGVGYSDEQQPETSLSARVNQFLPMGADHLGIVTSNSISDLNSLASLRHTVSVPSVPSGNLSSATTIGRDASLPVLTAVSSLEGFNHAGPGVVEDNGHAMNASLGERKARHITTTLVKPEEAVAPKDLEQQVKSGGFSRFRPSNISIRQRQKRRSSSPQASPTGLEEMEAPIIAALPATEKSKLGRFGLGKKKGPFSP